MDNWAIEDKTGEPELFLLEGSPDVDTTTFKKNGPKLTSTTKVAKDMKNIFASSLCRSKLNKSEKVPKGKKNEEDIDIDDVYIDMGGKGTPVDNELRKISNLNDLMDKSVIVPGFDRLHTVPSSEAGKYTEKKERKKEKEKTKGAKWFNMPAPEMTDELKKELQVLQMRSVLDPKTFYKKNTVKTLPKYFQLGRVAESSADFYHSRIPKKERKKTMVEELLADSKFKKYNKKRYTEIIEDRRKTNFKAHKHAKRLKNRKK